MSKISHWFMCLYLHAVINLLLLTYFKICSWCCWLCRRWNNLIVIRHLYYLQRFRMLLLWHLFLIWTVFVFNLLNICILNFSWLLFIRAFFLLFLLYPNLYFLRNYLTTLFIFRFIIFSYNFRFYFLSF